MTVVGKSQCQPVVDLHNRLPSNLLRWKLMSRANLPICRCGKGHDAGSLDLGQDNCNAACSVSGMSASHPWEIVGSRPKADVRPFSWQSGRRGRDYAVERAF